MMLIVKESETAVEALAAISHVQVYDPADRPSEASV
jgi:hypothetical protein